MFFVESTSTDDIWGEVEAEKEMNLDFCFSEELQKFVGKNHQLVPKTSNKKVNGKKLMDYQREGLEVPKVYSDIEIYSMEDLGDYSFKVACSSGTYVRSICRDLALNTNNLGCMKSLRRTKVGRFTIDQAQTLEDLETQEPILYPSIYVLDHLDKINYQPIEDVYQGKRIRLDNSNNEVCILDAGKPIAIYEKEREGLFKSKRGLW